MRLSAKVTLVVLVLAVMALAAEMGYGSLSGTNTQTLTVGKGSTRLAIQCTTPVRYRISQDAASTVVATDPLVAVGDPYIIDKPQGYNRLNIAHQDLATSISCNVFRRVP